MGMLNFSDQELIQQYMNGNKFAMERLLARHKDKIFTAIIIKMKDEYLAEDIFQECFIKAIDTINAGKYNDEGKFLSWIMRIAHNLCMDHFRKSKRSPSFVNNEDGDVFDFIKSEEISPEMHWDKVKDENKLKAIIEQLPEDQKEVLMLRHYFDFSFKEVAEYTNVSINTSLGRMRYALINLRKLLEQNRADEESAKSA